MLVDPLSVDTPFDWTILQKDQHRRSISMTPGLTGIQSYNDWISQVVKTVQSLIRVMFRIRRGMIASSLSAVSWIQGKTGIAPPRELAESSFLLGEGGF